MLEFDSNQFKLISQIKNTATPSNQNGIILEVLHWLLAVRDLHLRVLDLLGDLQEARGDALALRGAHASDLLEHLAGLRKV